MRALLACLLMIFCIGCSGHHSYHYTNLPPNTSTIEIIPVYIDVRFGQADRIAIDNSLNAWNYALNNYIKLEVISYTFDMDPNDIKAALSNNGILIMRINSHNPIIPPSTDENTMVLAFVDRVGGNLFYVVRDRITNDQLQQITLHELGHIMGCCSSQNHHLYDTSLMNKFYNSEYMRCIDKATIIEVAAFRKLDPTKLNYCVF